MPVHDIKCIGVCRHIQSYQPATSNKTTSPNIIRDREEREREIERKRVIERERERDRERGRERDIEECGVSPECAVVW